MAKRSKKPSVRIKKVCISKIKKGKNKGQCKTMGYQVGDNPKNQFKLKKRALKKQGIMKRKYGIK
ncbi:MAG: hypothetical protein R3321_07050 [Nitrososphaeraceae archaeon]|nr:hypothetical protein [Nitrososphaeraceae archaeon]